MSGEPTAADATHEMCPTCDGAGTVPVDPSGLDEWLRGNAAGRDKCHRDAHADLAATRARLATVEALHQPFSRHHEPGVSDECNECGPPYPCATVRAVLALVAALPQGRDEADRATCGARIDLGPRIHAVCSLPVLHNGPHSDAAAPAPRDDTATPATGEPGEGATTYLPFDQGVCLGDPPWSPDDPALQAWEAGHGHDVRLKCYVEFGCRAVENEANMLSRDLAAARSEAAGLRQRLAAVEALHQRISVQVGSKTHGGPPEFGDICRMCRVSYPCLTVRAALAAEAAPTEASPAPAPGDETP